MPDPAERIFDAAAATLARQQARVDQILSSVAPLGAGAAAGALLIKPALHDIAHADWPQVVGAVVGLAGIALVLGAGILVLSGLELRGVDPGELAALAEGPPDLSDDAPAFQLEAAAKLGNIRAGNIPPLRWFKFKFALVALGLLLEIAGLATAAELQPSGHSATSKHVAKLRVTGRITPSAVVLAGRLAPTASGRVRVIVLARGRGSERLARFAPLKRGRFSARLVAAKRVRPLRSAQYKVTWAGTKTVAAAHFAGSARAR